jgi:predicted outer membrane repeat protein
MNTRALFRWTLSIVLAVGFLGIIGLALNPPVQARPQERAAALHDWPDLLPPCNASLQQCIDAAVVQPGDTIRIKPGVYTESATLSKSVSLVGDNRFATVLIAQPGQRVLTVTANVSATTIISGLSFKRGAVGGSVCPDACGGGVALWGLARPTLQNLIIAENSAAWQGGGMWVDGGTEVKLVNVSFISNTSGSDGGGLWTMANTQLFNTNFERNTSGEDGGGVYVSGALSLYASDSTFFKNRAISGGGGGAYVGSVATLNGGWVRENSATSGGGLLVSSLFFTATEVTTNTATGDGGGAAVFGPARLQGGKFTGNSSSNGSGGALTASSLQAQYTYFTNNTATGGSIQHGGAAYVLSGPNDLDRVWFQRNEAQSNGGALYATGPTTLSGVSLISNTAFAGQGGGAFVGSPVVVMGGSYVDNFASNSGGAIFAPGIHLDSAHLDSNRTAGSGGAVHADNALLWINRSELRNNQAGQRGGGAYATGSFNIANSVFLNNEAFASGGGLYHENAGNGRVVNSLFARNRGNESGAALVLMASASTVDIVHTTIVDQPRNADIGINNSGASLNISNTIIAGHATGINSLAFTQHGYMLYFDNGAPIQGNFNTAGPIITGTDPLFANVAADDYHLRFNSPAINVGANAGVFNDFDGQPRPIGPGFDIGFDEAASSIQEMIDFTPPGGTVNIPPGFYPESLNLYKPVNLIGAGSGSTFIQAVANDRVLTVTGSTITRATQIANLTLQGGSVVGGGFERAGGGVLITDTAYPTFDNVQITGNTADFGGGLYVHSGGAALYYTVLANNHANQSGGGAYVVEPGAVLEQIGGVISNNTAIDGAGVFVQSGQFQQSSGMIISNTASNWGGGILVAGGSARTTLGQIVDNVAQNAGGGVLVDMGTAELQNSVLKGNSAYEGGGVYVRDLPGSGAFLIGGTAEDNTAIGYGGGAYALGTLHITGTKFFNNRAYDGSALEISGTAQARVVNTIIAGNPANGPFPSTNSSVRFDSGANSVVFHATFANATQPLSRALTIHNGVVTVANTIVASYTIGLTWFGGHLAEDYNLFHATPLAVSGSFSSGGHSLVGPDPLFRGAAIGDYHIKGLSPAVNRGTNVGVRRDIDSDARPLGGGFDIGADEASVAGAVPGPNTGGQFIYTTTANSTINLNVPPGAVTQTTPIYCSLIDTTTVQPPRRFRFAGVVFEIDADLDPVNATPGSINFNVPVTLSVSYTDAELAAAGITDELTLQLYRFEPLLNDWKPIGFRPNETQTLDVDNNLITATLLGFSRLGKMGATAEYGIFLPIILR